MLPLVIGAIAVNLFTVAFVLSAADGGSSEAARARREARRDARRARRESARAARAAAAAAPWEANVEPLPEPELVGSGALGGAVLAYIDAPRRSPHPERLIQTEVLLPTGLNAWLSKVLRLVAGLLVFGTLLGFSIIGFVRAVIWLIARLSSS